MTMVAESPCPGKRTVTHRRVLATRMLTGERGKDLNGNGGGRGGVVLVLGTVVPKHTLKYFIKYLLELYFFEHL